MDKIFPYQFAIKNAYCVPKRWCEDQFGPSADIHGLQNEDRWFYYGNYCFFVYFKYEADAIIFKLYWEQAIVW